MPDSAMANELHKVLDSVSAVEPSELIHCSLCQHPVSAAQFRIRINGDYQHRFSNPSQQVFDVVCLQMAPGVAIRGDATSEHTWFQGFTWQFGHCEQCGEHLGWYYQGSSTAPSTTTPSFFALISARLKEAR